MTEKRTIQAIWVNGEKWSQLNTGGDQAGMWNGEIVRIEEKEDLYIAMTDIGEQIEIPRAYVTGVVYAPKDD